jgi:hypothetical protein
MTEAALPVTSSFQSRIDEHQASAKAARDSAQALKDQIDAVEKVVNDLQVCRWTELGQGALCSEFWRHAEEGDQAA